MRRAFTLIELLVVIGILGVLAAILLPVLAYARRQGYRATSTSNLRQCGAALRMYADDNGGEARLPPPDTAKRILGWDLTCDPADHWRRSCTEDRGTPMVGSHAYVVGTDLCKALDDCGMAHLNLPSSPVMASVFHSSPPITAFYGETPPSGPIDPKNNYNMPTHVLRLRMDGSVHMDRVNAAAGGYTIAWHWIFWP